MANSMTGRVHYISPTETIASRSDATKTFQKRMIVLDCTRYDQYTGERGFENFPSFEFSGEKCRMLDGYKEGDVATVWFDLQGRKFVCEEGKDRWFTTIRGYKIELARVRSEAQGASKSSEPIMQNGIENSTPIVESSDDGAIDDLPF